MVVGNEVLSGKIQDTNSVWLGACFCITTAKFPSCIPVAFCSRNLLCLCINSYFFPVDARSSLALLEGGRPRPYGDDS